MTGIQCAALRIDRIAEEDASLWLWSTARNVGDAMLLMQLWSFKYAGLFIWQKPPGLGPWIRHDSEFLLRGVRPGAEIKLPAPVQTHRWPRPPRHSEKPAEAYAMIAELCEGPRIDIFARQARPGFEAWGNQAPDAAADSDSATREGPPCLSACLAAAGCAAPSLPGDPAGMSAEQLRELAKDRSASIGCIATQSLAVDVTALYITLDRSVITSGGLDVSGGCQVRLHTAPRTRAPALPASAAAD